jgi:hypothetical protein
MIALIDTSTKQRILKMKGDLINLELPKWSQMIVSGVSVTPEQAKNIIFRTDPFLTTMSPYYGGNNSKFNSTYFKKSKKEEFHRHPMLDEIESTLFEELGVIKTEYVRNDFASSSFIMGAQGWCHPDGTIQYVDNIGSWASVEDVLCEWTLIAKRFPILDLNVTLMSGESLNEDKQPLVNISVKNGVATLCEPDLSVHEGKTPVGVDIDGNEMVKRYKTENALPDEWVEYYAKTVASALGCIGENYS